MESHGDMVRRLKKPGNEILSSLTPGRCDAIHMAMGIAGEAGEIIDAVKKWSVYNKELDRENVVEELGDLLFYAVGLMQVLGVTQKEVELRNMAKLSTGKNARYKEGYSDAAAQARADKAVQQRDVDAGQNDVVRSLPSPPDVDEMASDL